jgi:hypothetical protein
MQQIFSRLQDSSFPNVRRPQPSPELNVEICGIQRFGVLEMEGEWSLMVGCTIVR